MINLTINGRSVEAQERTSLLYICRELGIEIPTLCYLDGLEPYGACRLCCVEVMRGKRKRLVTSCNYPAEEGIIVYTNSERVIKNRKMILELLLARCPEAKIVQDLAAQYGIKEPRFEKEEESCTLCGLCVRVCHEVMKIGAINFFNRGIERKVDTPKGELSEICQTCGACALVCPTGAIKLEKISKNISRPLLSEFDEGLNPRGSIYLLYPQAIPNVPVIDKESCVYQLTENCKFCEKVCQAKAIKYDQKDEIIDLEVGSVILAPGYDKFDARIKKEYGYGKYKNVVTSLEFERILSPSGPFQGHLKRLSDEKEPSKIAFIQCVGSRDISSGNLYCSSVCCTYAVKEAIIAKEHSQNGLETTIFFIDMRTYGKGFEEYYRRAKDEHGVRFIRARVSKIYEIPENQNLKVSYEDEKGYLKDEEFELIVLSVGFKFSKRTKELAKILGIRLSESGFCQTIETAPIETNRLGIFACGAFQSPKDIPETVMQASGAAGESSALLSTSRGTLITRKEYPPEIDTKTEEPRIGVFVCHCGINIAGVVNVPEVTEYVKTLPNVVYMESNLYTCSQDAQEKIKEKIKEYKLNRIVVASCTPRTHELLFRNTIREAGLNPYLFEMANIREHCSWVHAEEKEKATKKAKDLVRMAVAKARFLEPLYGKTLKVNKTALIIGGGLSGMTASLNLAQQGFEVHLVEKENHLGGNLQRLYYLIDGEDSKKILTKIIEKINGEKNVHIYTNSTISKVEGSLGDFKTTIFSNGKEVEIKNGAIILATGAEESKPREYLYGEDERVLTQLEFEEKVDKNEIQNARCIVMIQCVGSRSHERPYCSRLCCSQAVKNALNIKERNPKTEVYILYRDIRTYSLKEEYYFKARKAGVIFIRYEEEEKPQVFLDNNKGLKVEIVDPILDIKVALHPDLLILSPAIIPHKKNKDLAQILKVPLDSNGFFLEAHMKLRPVDFSTDGIYLCGLAHSPKIASESIAQANAAAERSSIIISQDEIELEATLSFVVDENCDGCAYCIDPCPYKAITLIEYMWQGSIKKTVEVNESLCKGCGVCMATCPKKGIYVKNFKLEQLSAMVEAALQRA